MPRFTCLRIAAVPVLVASLHCSAEQAGAQQSQAPPYGAPPAAAANISGLQVAAAPQVPAAAMSPPPADAPVAPSASPVVPPGPPFQLTDVEQQFVVQVLQMWEAESTKINTFSSKFHRWEYDAVFGPGLDQPLIKSTGTLSFSKPDKGSMKIEKISRWTKKNPQDQTPKPEGDWQPQPDEIGEHWVCDGKAIYEFNHRDKQLVVRNIPAEMQGKDIVDGPLPFLFGAEAKKLMERYWIRSQAGNAEEIFLEAYPRLQVDAANYDRVDVQLDRKTMQPRAIQVHLPGGQQRHVYMFPAGDTKVNASMLGGAWFKEIFSAPRKPLGWTKVEVDATPLPQAANPQPGVQR
jgi:TIGR03009 family protein